MLSLYRSGYLRIHFSLTLINQLYNANIIDEIKVITFHFKHSPPEPTIVLFSASIVVRQLFGKAWR